MNRQQRRLLQRQGRSDDDGEATEAALPPPAAETPEAVATRVAPPSTARRRTSPREFLHEVNVELRKVAWPTRSETINYSTVVFLTVALLIGLVFALDLAFANLSNFLFK